YSLAYSVLTPITNGETGLQVRALAKADESRSLLDADIRVVDGFFGVTETSVPISNFFGLKMSGWEGFYFCAILLIIAFYISLRIFRSDFGLMLRAIKSNQNRLNYTGINTRPYLIVAFVISGMYAGLAGSLLAVTDPLAGAERMQWTESGLVVLMTILGGVGTLIGPLIGAGLIKYLEQIFSSINEQILEATFAFLPETLQHFFVGITSLFVGEGWELTLGLMFMIVVIFVPGGIMEIISRLIGLFRKKPTDNKPLAGEAQPAE
ncbi:MAG: branched-chain amino acid ABC transporter permease, partial [Hyphomicrobiales bacterium]